MCPWMTLCSNAAWHTSTLYCSARISKCSDIHTGYANEVGEAFRSLTSVTFVRATYGVATAYVLADTYDKAAKMDKVMAKPVL